MTLSMTEQGQMILKGDVTFDNALEIANQGLEMLAQSTQNKRVEISLEHLAHADSSALSVFLTWLRYSRQQQMSLCFTNVPCGLYALATLCGMHDILSDASCSL